LSSVPPLSWDAVHLVYAYAFGFTAVVALLLIALAAVLLAYEVCERYVFILRER
jgi:hypothetical protein